MRRAAVLVLLWLTACGGPPGIGREASQALSPQVASIREAAEGGAHDIAAERLALLKITAFQLREEGTLDEGGYERVIDSADDVLNLLSAEAEEGPQLRVPIEDLEVPVQQAPAGAAGGRDGDDGERGDDGEKGEKGEKGDKGERGRKGNEKDD